MSASADNILFLEDCMSNLNSVLIEGRLTRDAEFRTFQASGRTVCMLSLASNRYVKKANEILEEVSYFDIDAWTPLAEQCREAGKKGRGLKVVGRLRQDRWKDDEGKTRSKVVIVAEHIEFQPMRSTITSFAQMSAVANDNALAKECAGASVSASADKAFEDIPF
jgi:single-strand DNA-binding protein